MFFLKSTNILYLLLFITAAAVNGQSNTTLEGDLYTSRILNGGPSQGPIKFQVSLQKKSGNNGFKSFCSAIIISANFVLTAAHCVAGQNVNLLSIQAGVADLSSTLGSRHYVEGYKVHESYVTGGINNIAIVKVTPPLILNDVTIAAIDFTSTTVVGDRVSVLLSGWGAIDATGLLYSQKLQKLRVTTITNALCQQFYSEIADSEICTYRTVFRSACIGDGGGPVTNTDGTILIGIISFGTKPCGTARPDVHTRVSSFVDWITTKMAEVWP